MESICGSSRRPTSVCASQWLDMTSYDRETTFGLYMAVLKKTDPSPLLPESDEDRGVGTGRSRPAPGACDPPGGGALEALVVKVNHRQRGPRGPVTVQVDFDDCHKESSLYPAFRNGNTRIYKQRSMDPCSTWKLVEPQDPETICNVTDSAIVARTRS